RTRLHRWRHGPMRRSMRPPRSPARSSAAGRDDASFWGPASRTAAQPRCRRPDDASDDGSEPMPHLNIDKLKAAKVETSPYLYTIVPGFLSPETVARINATYPKIEKGGSYPIESL